MVSNFCETIQEKFDAYLDRIDVVRAEDSRAMFVADEVNNDCRTKSARHNRFEDERVLEVIDSVVNFICCYEELADNSNTI